MRPAAIQRRIDEEARARNDKERRVLRGFRLANAHTKTTMKALAGTDNEALLALCDAVLARN